MSGKLKLRQKCIVFQYSDSADLTNSVDAVIAFFEFCFNFFDSIHSSTKGLAIFSIRCEYCADNIWCSSYY